MPGPGIDIGFIGVPFDGAVTNRPGARHGPRHLRDQSTLMGAYNHQTGVIPNKLVEAADLGDVPLEGVYELDKAIAEIEAWYDTVCAAGVAPLTAGGDHSITLPIMRALARRTGPLGMVHFDAHCDTGPNSSATSTTRRPLPLAGRKARWTRSAPFNRIRGPRASGVSYRARHDRDPHRGAVCDGLRRSSRRRAGVGEGPTTSASMSSPGPGVCSWHRNAGGRGFNTYEAQQMLRGLHGPDIVRDVVEVSPRSTHPHDGLNGSRCVSRSTASWPKGSRRKDEKA